MYPVGWPLWKWLARAGVPLRFALTIHFDGESKTFWADSPQIDGLVVAGADLHEIRHEAMQAAGTLLQLHLHRSPKLRPHWRMDDALAQA